MLELVNLQQKMGVGCSHNNVEWWVLCRNCGTGYGICRQCGGWTPSDKL